MPDRRRSEQARFEDMEGQEETMFDLPVDSEHKALRIKIFSFAVPHMRAFHLCWFGFFTSFVSTFAPAAMIPALRESIDVDANQLGNAGIAAVSGTIIARVAMGSVCDWIGPRLGMSSVLLTSSAFVFGLALANGPVSFALLRFGIGFGLSAFVACQFWTASMFNVKIVGIANATTGGWGNLGGGLTQILMPMVLNIMTLGHEPFIAWRYAMFVPGFMHILGGIMILFFSMDLPDGNYAVLKQAGAMNQENPYNVMINAVTNYSDVRTCRTWCLTITYGFCFGIELTMNNIIVQYLFDQFGVSLTIAGLLGSLFGLMNICARSIGGLGSDMMGKQFGMRGRLWALWILQTSEGALCIFMGLAKGSLGATMVLMVIFSLLVQSSEGATYGVVPFVSKRSLGVVSGFVGAGGNAGSVITQALFFKTDKYEVYEGLIYMGIMVLCMTLFVVPVYFPMWGSMLFGPKAGVTEEDYYMGEFSDQERASGLADAALKFAQESKSQRAPRFRDLPPVGETHSADFNSSEICAPPGKKRATNPPKKKENYTGKEKSRKIEAASAETVQKMAMNGMHDVGIQVEMDTIEEHVEPHNNLQFQEESEFILMTPAPPRGNRKQQQYMGRMDPVVADVIPEGDEEQVSNSQGTQETAQDIDDDMDDFMMPPPPMHRNSARPDNSNTRGGASGKEVRGGAHEAAQRSPAQPAPRRHSPGSRRSSRVPQRGVHDSVYASHENFNSGSANLGSSELRVEPSTPSRRRRNAPEPHCGRNEVFSVAPRGRSRNGR